MTIEIKDDVICNKKSQYSFLTDHMIIMLKKNPHKLKLINKEINELLNTKTHDDAIKIINNRYNHGKTEEKRKLVLSIMEHYYKERYDFSSLNDSYDSEDEPEVFDITNYPKFKWKDNQMDAINETMDSTNNNEFGFKVPLSGIHCQATGSGKTFIAKNIIHKTSLLNNFNTKMTIIWFTERKSILMNNFYKLDYNNHYASHHENYFKWKSWDIIDMSKFMIYQFVDDKDPKWYGTINKKTTKPKFIIINRAFLSNKEKYKYIKKNKPCLIIHDECHSATNETSHKFLTYARKHWDSSIIGFSATPIRINNKNEYKEDDKKKLIEIFGIPAKVNGINETINIISNYNINIAIQDRVILPPKFKWYMLEDDSDKSNNYIYMTLNGKHADILKQNFLMAMKELNKCYPELIFKKTIAWTKTINQAEQWKQLFEIHKIKKKKNGNWRYKNLYKIKSYVDHSKNEDEEYLEFEKKESECIIFCVGKHREGSDIPYLDSCIFLDCVKNRSSKEFIQCIGRVLRIFGDKKDGLVIDGLIRENNDLHEKVIVDKIIGYYLILKNMELMFDEKIEKIKEYNKIKNNIIFDKENKKIRLKINKKNYIEIKCNEFDWTIIGDVFNKVLKKELKFDKMDEFIELKNDVAKYKFKDKKEYYSALTKLLCTKKKSLIDLDSDSEDNTTLHNCNNWPENPKVEYLMYWDSWYDFLGTNTGNFIQSKKEWIQYCKKKVKNLDDYHKLCLKKKKLPRMPEEFYNGFNDIENELYPEEHMFVF